MNLNEVTVLDDVAVRGGALDEEAFHLLDRIPEEADRVAGADVVDAEGAAVVAVAHGDGARADREGGRGGDGHDLVASIAAADHDLEKRVARGQPPGVA